MSNSGVFHSLFKYCVLAVIAVVVGGMNVVYIIMSFTFLGTQNCRKDHCLGVSKFQNFPGGASPQTPPKWLVAPLYFISG